MLLPSALGFSPHPPVSVYGTGPQYTIAAFLGSGYSGFPTLTFGPHHTRIPDGGFSSHPSMYLYRAFLSRLRPGHCVTTVLILRGTGISTCCPSTTSFDLALGPDFPRADQRYSGNLGYSAGRILTFLSLLIPAFSLLKSPQLLIGTASSRQQCSSTDVFTYIPRLRCHVSAPDIFGAGPLD